jgi:hypothetical protein
MIDKIDFEKNDGLIPVITQDTTTNEVLMLAYMNKEALELTLKTHNSVYSYRQNHTILQMLNYHKDIKNFFGSISSNMIKKHLKFNLNDINIDHIIDLITTIDCHFASKKLFICSKNVSTGAFSAFYSHF